ncbi:hypothetical protein [Flavobacterium ginsengisoli]|uniref:hypothetical protein n=1 Tax=Flavobacterium ginsengisoli TaxID=871694 RepID=UPI00241594A7|nr:hypothetical protein [Flavobacterium ginsengisoli]
MIKRIKHSLEYLLDKSSRGKTSSAEENLLHDFAFDEYQNSKWDNDLMGNPEIESQNIYDEIQIRIGKKRSFSPYLKYMVAASILFLLGLGFFLRPNVLNQKQITFKTSSIPQSIQLSDGSKIYLATKLIISVS